MTCIVGLVADGKVYLGGDSAGIGPGWDRVSRLDPKVGNVGEFVLGFTDSFRMGQVLLYDFVPPTVPYTCPDLLRYMVGEFVPVLRETLRLAGYAVNKGGREEGGTFLAGLRGRLFRVDGDYQVGESSNRFDAVGCGGAIASGSLFTSSRWTTWSPESRLKVALEAASTLSAGVCGPYKIVSTT